jgi:hypothetical protein
MNTDITPITAKFYAEDGIELAELQMSAQSFIEAGIDAAIVEYIQNVVKEYMKSKS